MPVAAIACGTRVAASIHAPGVLLQLIQQFRLDSDPRFLRSMDEIPGLVVLV